MSAPFLLCKELDAPSISDSSRHIQARPLQPGMNNTNPGPLESHSLLRQVPAGSIWFAKTAGTMYNHRHEYRRDRQYGQHRRDRHHGQHRRYRLYIQYGRRRNRRHGRRRRDKGKNERRKILLQGMGCMPWGHFLLSAVGQRLPVRQDRIPAVWHRLHISSLPAAVCGHTLRCGGHNGHCRVLHHTQEVRASESQEPLARGSPFRLPDNRAVCVFLHRTVQHIRGEIIRAQRPWSVLHHTCRVLPVPHGEVQSCKARGMHPGLWRRHTD